MLVPRKTPASIGDGPNAAWAIHGYVNIERRPKIVMHATA